MTTSLNRAARITAIALLAIVVTQVLYISLGNFGITPNRQAIWGFETIAFGAIALFGMALLPARPIVGSAIGLGGTLNLAQAGMGLVMFGPLGEAGEPLGAAFQAVLAMAFLLYFAGKAAFAVGGIVLGWSQWQAGAGAAKIVGLLAALTGVAGLITNLVAVVIGMGDITFIAGAAGTAATLFLALALWLDKPDSARTEG